MDLELINLIDHDTTKIFSHKIPLVFERNKEENPINEDGSLVDIYHTQNDCDTDDDNDKSSKGNSNLINTDPDEIMSIQRKKKKKTSKLNESDGSVVHN